MAKVEGLGKWKDQVKNIIDHNIALILFNFRQTSAAIDHAQFEEDFAEEDLVEESVLLLLGG